MLIYFFVFAESFRESIMDAAALLAENENLRKEVEALLHAKEVAKEKVRVRCCVVIQITS